MKINFEIREFFIYLRSVIDISLLNKNTMAIKFSVIIPTFNADKYLNKCLDSILKQSYNNYEIILIDDLSSDKTRDIIKHYESKDNRIKVIFNSENTGPALTRQKGINLSVGEYVTFVDSDDWYCDSRALEKIALIIEKNNSDCICFRYKTLHNHNIVINKKNGPKDGCYSCKSVALFKEKTQSPFWHYLWNKVYKSSIIKDNNILFNFNMRSAEDVKFNQEFLTYAKSFYISTDYMYVYNCKNSLSLTRNTSNSIKNDNLIQKWNYIKNEYKSLKDSYKKIDATDSCFKYLIANTLLKYDNLLYHSKMEKVSSRFERSTYNDYILLECKNNIDKKYYILKIKNRYIKILQNIKNKIKKMIV